MLNPPYILTFGFIDNIKIMFAIILVKRQVNMYTHLLKSNIITTNIMSLFLFCFRLFATQNTLIKYARAHAIIIFHLLRTTLIKSSSKMYYLQQSSWRDVNNLRYWSYSFCTYELTMYVNCIAQLSHLRQMTVIQKF